MSPPSWPPHAVNDPSESRRARVASPPPLPVPPPPHVPLSGRSLTPTRSPRVENPVLDLNVGGHRFTTLLVTLLIQGETPLTRYLTASDAPRPRDVDGRVVVDRDPDAFALVLNFHRVS